MKHYLLPTAFLFIASSLLLDPATAQTIAGGNSYSLALCSDSTARAWGWNDHGQLGDGTNNNSDVPVQVIGLCTMAIAVEEIPDGTSIIVFPNPTAGRFTIQAPATGAQLEIRDALGQEVHRSQLHGPLSAVDLSSQPDGIYFLTMRTPERVVTRRLIKQ